MNKILSPTIILTMFLPLVILCPSCKKSSFLEEKEGLRILHLEGTAYERGLDHGRLLKQEIHETISAWKQEVEAEFQQGLDSVLTRFFLATTFEPDLKKSHPELMEELRGLSEAVDLPYRTLLAFQLSEEMFTILEKEARHHCTSIGITKTDSTPTLLGQNMDPPPFLHGHAFVMHLIPEGNEPESYILTVPGLLGMTGMNEHGVGICCMSISMLKHANKGIPVIGVVRDVLAMADLKAAEVYLEAVSFAIPQCYTIGGPQGVRCFECSANEVAEFYPFEQPDIALHTNFSINNRDFNREYIELLAMYGKTIDDPYFCPRFFHAYDKIEEAARRLDVNKIESILRLPEPELESILNENTLGSLVMELDGDPVFNIALGNSEGATFQTLTFR